MNAAYNDIKRCARDRNAKFDTPAGKHVGNRIQSAQLSELQHIISTHKQRQSEKRSILRGETIIATPGNLRYIEKAEASSKSRTPSNTKAAYPIPPGAPTNHRSPANMIPRSPLVITTFWITLL